MTSRAEKYLSLLIMAIILLIEMEVAKQKHKIGKFGNAELLATINRIQMEAGELKKTLKYYESW